VRLPTVFVSNQYNFVRSVVTAKVMFSLDSYSLLLAIVSDEMSYIDVVNYAYRSNCFLTRFCAV